MKLPDNKLEVPAVKGNPVVQPTLQPMLWWNFDEGVNDLAKEEFTKTISEVKGHKTLWRKGVSGSALQFDDYYSEISLSAEKVPEVSGALTIESWVALGAYPWSDVPIIQQLDDVPEEMLGTEGKRGTKEFRFLFKEEHDKGFFLGIDGYGAPLFRINIDGYHHQLKTNMILERRKWIHIVGTYDAGSGLMKIFVNREKNGEKHVGKSGVIQSQSDIRIGKGKERRPSSPVRNSTFAGSYSLDGLIDVVVEFDYTPSKFIFWRGTSYIPMMVNEKGQWYSNEFNETWNTSGGAGCQEPMSDKKSYMNHIRILENTPDRTVVHWRYPLVNVDKIIANYSDTTGWSDWSDWYYYVYPDGVAVKSMKLWTHGVRNHEWQESMAIFGPDQHPEYIVSKEETLTMINLKGEKVTYNWINNPPPDVKKPEDQCIQIVNFTGRYKPVTIGKFTGSDVYGGELTEYSVFPVWKHWPVAQTPFDGRYVTYPDRTARSSLTHLLPEVYREEVAVSAPFYTKLIMEGMLDWGTDTLLMLAKSWLNALRVANLKGAAGEYKPNQRAYVLVKEKGDVSFSVDANEESPVHNLAIIIKNWQSKQLAKVFVNASLVQNKQCIFRDTDGTRTLTLWIEINERRRISIDII